MACCRLVGYTRTRNVSCTVAPRRERITDGRVRQADAGASAREGWPLVAGPKNADRALIGRQDAEERSGFSQVQVSRWRKVLDDARKIPPIGRQFPSRALSVAHSK